MSKALTPAQAARELTRRANALVPALLKAESENVAEAQRTAEALSQGPYSSQMLADMGHPYATRDPRPPGDPGVINKQSGLFARSWSKQQPYVTFGGIRSRVRNNASYAGDLDKGTSLMIARPIRARVHTIVRRRRIERLKGVLIKVLGAKPR